jgi:WD40 repeat protein
MEGSGTAEPHAEIARMQDGVRQWVRKLGRGRPADSGGSVAAGTTTEGRGLRLPPLAILAALTASACCPLLAVGAGAVTLATAGVLSAFGTGVLSGLLTAALDRARERRQQGEPSPAELEEAVAGQIVTVMEAGGDRARWLRAEIATVLREIDAAGVAVRTARESGHAQLDLDITNALVQIGDGFGELRFLIRDVEQTALSIQATLDEHGADLRNLVQQNYQQATDNQLILTELRAIRRTNLAAVAADGTVAEPRWTRDGPYRGLPPFETTDADVFYGRERLTAQLTVTARRQLTSGGIVVVTGASGAGKSSLLRAGFIPSLASGSLGAGSEEWPYYLIKPEDDPLAALGQPLEALGGYYGPERSPGMMLSGNPAEAPAMLRHALEMYNLRRYREARDSTRLVLIVDQFEQLFTLNPGPDGEAKRQEFITALCAMGTSSSPGRPPPAFVLIAVRGDFWGRCADYPMLKPQLLDGQFIVGPMTESELRQAIIGPAMATGLEIDRSLADLVVSDLHTAHARSGAVVGADGAGVLPLLSVAMQQTWENREGNRLTTRGYAAAGGVSHALSNYADKAFEALTLPQQAIARELLLRMTVAGPDGEFARRPVDRTDLSAGHPEADVDAVLEALANARLVVLDQRSASMSHDVLLRAWPRLRGWLEQDRGILILHGQLAEDATAWHEHREDPSYLYRGARLATFREAAATWASDPGRYPPLTGRERDFLAASESALAASERARARGARYRLAAVITLVALFITATVSAGVAYRSAGSARIAAARARQQARIAVAGQLAAESETRDSGDPVTASLLAAAAWRIYPSSTTLDSLLDAAAQPERASLSTDGLTVWDVAFSPHGKIVATASQDGTARLWDVATQQQIGTPLRADSSGVLGVAFSPDGTMLATASQDGTARLWDVATHQQIGAPLRADAAAVNAVAFSPDGKTLATASDDGTVRLWDVATHRQIGAPIDPVGGPVQRVAFGRGGIIATMTPAGVDLWNAATGIQIGQPIIVPGAWSMALNPAASIVVTMTVNGKIQLWNVATQTQIGRAMTAGGAIGSGLAFNPDGTILASGDGDGTARLWDVATQRQIGAPLPVANTFALAVAFSPNGTTLGVAAFGTAWLFDVSAFRPLGPVIWAGGASLSEVSFSPDGTLLATASEDGTTRLWHVATQREAGGPLAASGRQGLYTMAFSPNGQTLATGGNKGVIRFWDVTTRRQIGSPMAVDGKSITALAFSPDGKMLVTVGIDTTMQLWDVATRREVASFGRVDEFSAVAFSPDGTMVAAGDGAGAVRMWNVVTGRPVGGPLPGLTTAVTVGALAFSPDGTTLAAGGSDGVIRLWDVATGQLTGLPLVVNQASAVNGLAFSPNGTYLATATSDGAVRIWDVRTHQEIGAPLTESGMGWPSSVAFSPNGQTLAAAYSGGTALLWDVALPAAPINAVCEIAGRSLTRQDWTNYVPSLPYIRVCPAESG